MSPGSVRRAVLRAGVMLWSVALPAVGAAQDTLAPPPPPSARTAIKVLKVRFEDFGGQDRDASGLLRFTIVGEITQPQSQIVVVLSRPPADDEEEVELNVWLVDSTGEVVKVGPDATVEPWIPATTAIEEPRRDLDWVSLRPTSWDSLPGQSAKRGVFMIRVVAATDLKHRKQTPRFVLVNGDRQ